MISARSLARLSLAGLAILGLAAPAQAQILLYAQRLPEGTVYVRLASALPATASVQTDFAGKVRPGR